jgi:arabinogalactan oligomer/maltooligosaccharide transport system substrate-binding protein
MDSQGKAYLNTPKAVDAMVWLDGMKPYLPEEPGYPEVMKAMEEKRLASVWNGLWSMAQLKQAGLDLGVLPFGKTVISIQQIMMTASAMERNHAETALDIMKYYTSAEAQKKILLAAPDPDIANFIPARTAALEDPQVVPLENVAAFRAAFRMGVAVMTYRGVNSFNFVDGAVTAIWEGSQTPEEALAAAQAKLEAEIAKRK